ncbi:MAG: hypothetical protein LC754_01565 [Acidobacteria bacterium]|nr:hypothetical protein [Acidobacteriota bacterium]
MTRQHSPFRPLKLLVCAALLGGLFTFAATTTSAQEAKGPITSEELLQLVRQLPKRPGLKEEVVREIRRRGINFTLTNGLRSVVATKSGNDADLRRTLEEAERRFLNPSPASTVPPEAEGQALLQKARAASLEAAEAMPDFVVKQLITRAYALGATRNWLTQDRLTVGVSYRTKGGEQYKMLALNGLPAGSPQAEEKSDYADEVGVGATSTGEFVTTLSSLFAEETRAQFKLVDTDLLRGRRTLVYEYEVKQPFSKHALTFNKVNTVVAGYRGRVWIDRENSRVLRLESTSTDIPSDFPIRAAHREIDYDWVTIAEQKYLLPSRAVIEMSVSYKGQPYQSRNDIRFRNYQKYGTEIRIIEDDEVDDESKPQKP